MCRQFVFQWNHSYTLLRHFWQLITSDYVTTVTLMKLDLLCKKVEMMEKYSGTLYRHCRDLYFAHSTQLPLLLLPPVEWGVAL